MKACFRSIAVGVFSVLGLLAFVPVPSYAATIEIDTLLTNPSFESPTTQNSCPTGWTCSQPTNAGFGVYAPTSTQYTAGADGLPDSLLVPNGNQAVYSPDGTDAGAGTLEQDTTSTYAADTTYTFTFWVGLPNTFPPGTNCPGEGAPPCVTVGLPQTVRVYLLESSTGAAGTYTSDGLGSLGDGDGSKNISSPGLGKWEEVTMTLTAADIASAGVAGDYIGVEFFSSTGPGASANGNNEEVNFDIGTPDTPVPEPASATLLGGALLGLAAIVRRRQRRR